ncbi:MAG: hypothetical protein JWL77_7036 [Chthonomonadaceae bacterium]|nr:hypothetical protein [Chthonomonadaceae bacterium]
MRSVMSWASETSGSSRSALGAPDRLARVRLEGHALTVMGETADRYRLTLAELLCEAERQPARVVPARGLWRGSFSRSAPSAAAAG